jgi:hypothetical protein
VSPTPTQHDEIPREENNLISQNFKQSEHEKKKNTITEDKNIVMATVNSINFNHSISLNKIFDLFDLFKILL